MLIRQIGERHEGERGGRSEKDARLVMQLAFRRSKIKRSLQPDGEGSLCEFVP